MQTTKQVFVQVYYYSYNSGAANNYHGMIEMPVDSPEAGYTLRRRLMELAAKRGGSNWLYRNTGVEGFVKQPGSVIERQIVEHVLESN